ncbi:MAG: amino acid adenylation domain-containing protein [Synechococcales bacterium]|nr:amino acid adenylation domain-containing protein [Synechococcales bacterium]
MSTFLERIQTLSPNRLALLACELQSKLEAMESAKNEAIAVIGMGCRFPGDVADPEAYWQLLSSGQDPITEVPPDRWDVDAYYHSDPSTPGKTYTRWGGFLQGVDQFDADFFGISPREAEQMDPQQRLLLEVSWEALERAGYGPQQLVGSRTAVYVAICTADYANLQSRARDLTGIDTYTGFGSGFSFAAGRLSYVLGLQGPNMSLDAACTSSLMGVHLGCQSLRDRECEMALVGGVNLVLSPETNVICSRTRMMAADGRCKTFDAAADGYVRSEACGVVVLKRLGDAIAAGDNVLAVIKGSSIGHSGASGGFTIPNGTVQQNTIRTALAQAGVHPHQVQYIETQGTGTPLGDAIEIRALRAVFKEDRSPQDPLWLASVKTNIGNTETASGLAALIKVILSLQHQQLPPHLHLKQVNSDISLEDIPAKIPTKTVTWPQGQTRRIASINAYGMSGSTAHMVVESAPDPVQSSKSPQRRLHVLPLSAKTPEALRQLLQRYNEYLKTNPDCDLGNLCFTASVGRAHFSHRLAFVGNSTSQLQQQLSDYLESQSIPSAIQTRPKVLFSFSNKVGEADITLTKIRELYNIHPTFQRSAELLSLSPSLLTPSRPPISPSLIFSFQYALAQLWQSWGVQPESLIGEGIGRIVADCLSGQISLKAALQTVVSDQAIHQNVNQCETAQTDKPIGQDNDQYHLQISPQVAAWDNLMADLSQLYQQGAEVDWVEFYRPYSHQRLVLPTYPFQRQRYWSRLAELGTKAIATTSVPHEVKQYLSRESLLAMDPAQQQQRLAVDLCDRIAVALGANPTEITPDIPLDTLPLDSLMALEMKFDLEKTLGSTLPITSLLENRDIASLAAEMLEGVTAEPTALLPQLFPAPDERFQPFPLNDIQEAYWIGRSGLFEMGNVAAHVYSEFESVGGMDCDRLNQSFQQLIERHDMLRAVILPDGQQQILETVPAYTIEILDLRQASVDTVEQQLSSLRDRLSHKVHDAHQWPLFTVCAAQLDQGRVRLYLSFDNLLVDGTSMGLLCWEWGQLYQGLTDSLAPLTASFRDYVMALQVFEQSEVYQRSLDYWQARLPDLPPAPDLPLATAPANLQRPRFERLTAQIEPETWHHLQQQATQVGLTPSSLLVAVYAEVLATWSKTRRFNLNLTTFNRLPLHPKVQNIVGDFTSLTLLAVDYRDSESFWERAKQLQAQLWQDLEHGYVSGVRVLRELVRSSANRVTVPVVFTSLLANPQMSETKNRSTFGTDWLGQMVYGIAQTPQVWLDHQVYEEAGTLVLNWDYVADLFPAEMIEAMFETYVQGLRTLAQQPELGQQPRFLQLPGWQQSLQTRFNDTEVPFPDEYLHTLFLAQARRQPQYPAVITETLTLTYAELQQRSHQLSQSLQSLGVHTNQLIPVSMEKGWEQVVAVLGVLMAGAAYVPIDPALPQERRWQLLDQSLSPDDVPIVLTQRWLQAELSWPESVKSLVIDIHPIPPATDTLTRPTAQTTDLAYVIYTSGSTGTPKGVVIDHRSAVNTILDINRRWQVGPGDRIFALSSLSFDLSVYDLFGTLAAGGTIVMPPPQAAKDPVLWSEILRREQVTIWNSVPALMQMLVIHAADRPGILPPSLRLVLLSGDWLPLTLPAQIRALAPAAEVVSLGGATEASIWSIFYPIDQVETDWPSIPYGHPLANQEFYVLDTQLENCPIWVTGQLYIGGKGLANGYWRDHVKTAKSFISHPRTGEALYRTGDLGRYLPSGEIEFLGREDNQVKLGGYRIELGEIEQALEQHPNVVQSVALIAGDADSGQQLVAYVCPEGKRSADPPDPLPAQELKAYLDQKLPTYMVPHGYMTLKEIPLTSNGKVDRLYLESLWQVSSPSESAYIAPENALQSAVVEIWQEILKREPIGIQDNFFELGGDSLLAIQVMTRVREIFQVEVSLRHLFEDPSVAQLAEAIAQALAEQIDPELLTALEPDHELDVEASGAVPTTGGETIDG